MDQTVQQLSLIHIYVTIVQRPKQLMNPFDPDMASMIHNEMRKHGIKLVPVSYTHLSMKEITFQMASHAQDYLEVTIERHYTDIKELMRSYQKLILENQDVYKRQELH